MAGVAHAMHKFNITLIVCPLTAMLHIFHCLGTTYCNGYTPATATNHWQTLCDCHAPVTNSSTSFYIAKHADRDEPKEKEMATVIHQANVRRGVVVALIATLRRRGHRAYRNLDNADRARAESLLGN